MYGVSLRLIAICVTLCATFASGWWVNGNRWEKKHNAEVLQLAEKTKAVQDTVYATYVVERNKKDEEIRNLNNQLNDSIIKLRDRPSRTESAVAGTGIAPKGCNPTELYREYAQFLIQESNRADEIRLAYIELYNEYQTAKKALGQ